jgi:hypothetical protein
MADRQRHDNHELRHRDLSRKGVAQMSHEEKLELKRRFDEFVTAMRRGEASLPARRKPAKPVKWDPKAHSRR